MRAATTLRGTSSRHHPEIDAFLCYNDLVAVGALQACAALGRRVPEDVAVVGCDDILLAGLVKPPLTTLRSDKRALGAEAVRLLLRKLAGCADGCDNVVLQPELIVRASAPVVEITAEGAENAESKSGTSAPSASSAVELPSSKYKGIQAERER